MDAQFSYQGSGKSVGITEKNSKRLYSFFTGHGMWKGISRLPLLGGDFRESLLLWHDEEEKGFFPLMEELKLAIKEC